MVDKQRTEASSLDRALGVFSKVEAGEAGTALLMMANIFLVLLAYYTIKVVREPLILSIEPSGGIPGGAELKSYGAAGQAFVLMAFVPFYSWFSSRVDRMRLIIGVTLFYLVCIELFSFAVQVDVPYIGFVFFIWVGIFSLSVIAQFWSYANDVYTKEQGERLFPIIGIGMVAGAPVGSALAGLLFKAEVHSSSIMHVAAGILVLHLGLSVLVNRRIGKQVDAGSDEREEKLTGPGGFALILRSKYLILIALLLLLLNVVNTTGEYILGQKVMEAASESGQASRAFIGAFYGGFYSTVNVIALLLQAIVVSRLVKYTGLAGVVLLLPFVSLGAYALIGAGVAFSVLRWAKTAENATDYSVMNTAKGMLWLPLTREEKYKGKQAIDTFVVRLGDVMSAGVVALGVNLLHLGTTGFALANVGIALVWIGVGVLLVREHRKLSAGSAG